MASQIYERYTAEDFEVWTILYRRQIEFLRGRVYTGYDDDLDRLGFSEKQIPRFTDMNRRLEAIAGWRLQAVDGFQEPKTYLSLLARRRLPVSTDLRSMEELDHCKRPDIFHDLFGHSVLLVIPRFRAYLEDFSRLALTHIEDESFLSGISNFNKWVTEFGLIQENGATRAYGAGLLSSLGELDHALGDGPKRLPADARAMIFTPHVRAEYQEQYFVIDSFDWLAGAVPEIESILTS